VTCSAAHSSSVIGSSEIAQLIFVFVDQLFAMVYHNHDQATHKPPQFAQPLAVLDCALFAQAFRSPQSNNRGLHSEHRPQLLADRSDFRIVRA
jgi:hypothetical protein